MPAPPGVLDSAMATADKPPARSLLLQPLAVLRVAELRVAVLRVAALAGLAALCSTACSPVYPELPSAPDAGADATGAELPQNGGTILGDDGSCGTGCPQPPHSHATCKDGVCGYACKDEFLDCNGKLADGCETSIKTDAAHCGSCAGACGQVSHGAPLCIEYQCRAACDPGWGSCMNNPAACETHTDVDPYHCGDCQTQCPGGNHVAPHCQAGACTFHCADGWGDCNQDESDGCETHTDDDAQHCGACAVDCKELNCNHGTCTCASSTQTAQLSPLDLFIMMDQSGSMDLKTGTGISKWQAVSQAISAFLQDKASAGIGVGIQYFPLKTCSAVEYMTPEIAVAELPANATNLIASIAKHKPDGATPTAAALSGAIGYIQGYGQTHPGHTLAVVLATDGMPTGCAPNDTLTVVGQVASAGVQSAPKVRTFVIGVGNDTAALNAIATAGGTGAAIIVDTAGDVEKQFAAALKSIQGEALACAYAIPPAPDGKQVDLDKVNVQITLGNGQPQVQAYVGSEQACNAQTGGWYFDDPGAPTQILLCAKSCDLPLNVSSAKVEVTLGCARTNAGGAP